MAKKLGAALAMLMLIGISLSGCKTLQVEVQDTAHCYLKVAAPHLVRCVVDGKTVYEQTGPMRLDLDGCGGD